MPEKQPSFSEDELKNTTSRALNDAELIKGGAKYVGAEGGARLEVTKEQIDAIPKERESDVELGKKIEEFLPISEDFEVTSYQEGNRIRPWETKASTKPARIVPSSEHTYSVFIDGLPVKLHSIYIGRNGNLVALVALVKEKPVEGTTVYYTNVSSTDKSQRVEL